jgi:hypothetical protein
VLYSKAWDIKTLTYFHCFKSVAETFCSSFLGGDEELSTVSL